MLSLPPSVKIFVATGPTDMRNGFNGLANAAQYVLKQDPMSGHLFVFFNRRRTMVKALYWDRSGFWVLAKNIKKGRLWSLVGDHHYVSYHYREDWTKESTFSLLGQRQGWLQVDGYAGYEKIFRLGKAIEVGCWMHCRRYFERAFKGQELTAAYALGLIKDLYKIERCAKNEGDSPEERLTRRQTYSQPIFDKLKEWIDDNKDSTRPTSLLHKAFTYADNQWTALLRPLEDGRLELDNGDCERTMRGPAMGRRNWLFAGADTGAKRAATLYTVLESAARHGLNLRLYLRDVILKIAGGWPQSRLDELLPHRWLVLFADQVAAADAAAHRPLYDVV